MTEHDLFLFLKRTFCNGRRKSFKIIRPKVGSPDLVEKLLVEDERERDVDDGEVVDGQAAQDTDQEEVQVFFKAVRLKPGKIFSAKVLINLNLGTFLSPGNLI